MSTAPPSTFGALLKHYRLAAGLTQEALAERAGLSVRGLTNLEHGRTRTPRHDTLALLVAALGLSAPERALLDAARSPRGVASPLAPLVGRRGELDLLDHHLAGEGPALLLVAGEPGIGKTRLLQEVAQRAVAQGLTVLTGGCPRRGGQEPYAPLLDALEQYIRGQDPLALRRDLHGCAWLVRLLPELAEGPIPPLAPQTLPPEQERRLLFGAVRQFLANVAGRGPRSVGTGTVLVLDDLQWAGSDALDLLTFLLRSTAPGPLRVVGAYRDTEVQQHDPLAMLRADLAQAGLVAHHALGPLASPDAARLLDALLADGEGPGHAVAARVLQRAGGTPFFLVSYAQALGSGSAEAAEAVPWDVAQGVRQRMTLLPASGREVLGAAAIVGRQAPHALLVAALGQPEETVLAGLEAACRARLLLEEGDAAYTFAHDLIREVVEAEVSAARRAVLHRRVAEALEAGAVAAPPELLAYHYTRSGVPEQALPYLELAGDHAWSQRAHGAAERQYREALDRLEALGRTQDAVRVREKLGEVLYGAGRHEAVIAVLEPAAQALRAAADWARLGRVTARIGWAHAWRGRPEEGLARLRPVLALLERDHAHDAPGALAMLYETVGQLLLTGRYDESLAAHERAAAWAVRAADARLQALAGVQRASLLQLLGRLEEALQVGQETLPLAEAAGDPDVLRRAHCDLTYMHALRGAFATGRRHSARAVTVSAPMATPGEHALVLTIRGWLAVLSGDWREAHADLDQALTLGRQVDGLIVPAYTHIGRACLSLAEGDYAAATMAVQEALGLAETTGDLQARRWAARVMAELEVLAGRAAAAIARLEPLRDRPSLEEEDYDVTALLPVLAWAYLEQDRLDEATTTAAQALARARPEQMRLVLVDALRVQAMVALRQDDMSTAEQALAEGLELARAMPSPYAEARLLSVAGRLHHQAGEPQAARERLEEALALFRRLGAQRDTAGAEADMGSLSQKQRRTAPCLTEAQWGQIAALLPPRPRGRGRPRADDRRIVEAILYVQRHRCAWAELPAELGDEATAHRRWQEWQAAGLWEHIAALAGT